MSKKLCTLLLAMTLLVPFGAIAAEVHESTISVESSMNTEFAPDTVKIRFYIENSGVNVQEVKEKNDKIANTAINEIKKQLKDTESIKTVAFRVNSVYSYKDKVRIFQKYEVRNGFEVKLKDLSKITKIVNIALNSGVKNVESVNFSIENGEQVCNELMAKSISTAKARAQYLAQSAGTTLDKVKTINPYCSLNNSYIQPRYLMNASAKSVQAEDSMAGGIESIEPGAINVRASVNMTYYLK